MVVSEREKNIVMEEKEQKGRRVSFQIGWLEEDLKELSKEVLYFLEEVYFRRRFDMCESFRERVVWRV